MKDKSFPMLVLPIARRYRLGAGLPVLAGGAVLSRELLDAIHSAEQLRQRATAESEQLLARASAEAEALLAAARQETEARAQAAQRAVWAAAQQLLVQLRRQRAALLTEAGRMLDQITRAGLAQLLLEVPAGWAPASSIRLVLREWRAGHDAGSALLRVHPRDLAALPAALREGPYWKCVADPFIDPGACVLSLEGTDVSANYSASVRSLVESMGWGGGDYLNEEEI
jgi:flagellar biosynthesis/type III secretory pathway protein FliH